MAQRRVFVDCGSNLCKVLEERMQRGLDDEFFAFEPQPELAHVAAEVRSRHPDVKLHFEAKAVWVRDEELKFFLATRWGPNHRGGSTLMEGHTNNGSAVDYGRPIVVKAFDFSRWLLDTFTSANQVVVKMDIEGAEYPVLEKMMRDNSVSLVSEMIVEFHQNMNVTIEKGRHEALVGELKRRTKLVEWH
jgi:FkbM family methyltransferase